MGKEAIVCCLADHLSCGGSASYSQTLTFVRCMHLCLDQLQWVGERGGALQYILYADLHPWSK